MVKVVCNKCNNINKVQKGLKFIYCNNCGEKIEVESNMAKKKTPKKNVKKILLFTLIPLLLIVIALIILLPVRKIKNVIKVSEVTKYCETSDDCLLNKAVKKHLLSIAKYKIEDVKFNGDIGKYEVTVKQFGKTKKFTFELKDDAGPEIKTDEITLTTNGEVDFKQIEIVDFIDGKIDTLSENVKIEHDELDITKEGEYKITVSATDKFGNTTKKDITVKVVNAVPRSINFEFKESYEIGEPIELKATVYPENAYDKSLTWKVENKEVSESTISFSEGGQHSICASANAKGGTTSCTYVYVNYKCQSRYEFTYDGGSGDKLYVSKMGDICPGKYRVTAYQINYSICPMITFNMRTSYDYNPDMMMICNGYGNGKTHVLSEGTHVEIDGGYTKVIFDKVG